MAFGIPGSERTLAAPSRAFAYDARVGFWKMVKRITATSMAFRDERTRASRSRTPPSFWTLVRSRSATSTLPAASILCRALRRIRPLRPAEKSD